MPRSRYPVLGTRYALVHSWGRCRQWHRFPRHIYHEPPRVQGLIAVVMLIWSIPHGSDFDWTFLACHFAGLPPLLLDVCFDYL